MRRPVAAVVVSRLALAVVMVGQLLTGAAPGKAVLSPERPADQVPGVWVSTLLGIRGETAVGMWTGRVGTTGSVGATGTGSVGTTGTGSIGTIVWAWPLVGRPMIVRGFDPPARRWLPGHRGIDLGGLEGEAVLAVDDGVVTFSGQVAGVGVVSLTHASGLRSTYQPVSDPAARGERVRRGDRIGLLDGSGSHCAPSVCLHLGAVRGRDTYVDPTPLLLGVELALLPVGP